MCGAAIVPWSMVRVLNALLMVHAFVHDEIVIVRAGGVLSLIVTLLTIVFDGVLAA